MGAGPFREGSSPTRDPGGEEIPRMLALLVAAAADNARNHFSACHSSSAAALGLLAKAARKSFRLYASSPAGFCLPYPPAQAAMCTRVAESRCHCRCDTTGNSEIFCPPSPFKRAIRKFQQFLDSPKRVPRISSPSASGSCCSSGVWLIAGFRRTDRRDPKSGMWAGCWANRVQGSA